MCRMIMYIKGIRFTYLERHENKHITTNIIFIKILFKIRFTCVN